MPWLTPLSPTAPTAQDTLRSAPATRADGRSFQQFVQEALAGKPLQLSGHAKVRLQERGVQWSASDWTKLQSAVELARGKGARAAYLVYGPVGLIVNVPTATVVTALEHTSQTVVTNIDSVVVV
ncbi:MAG: hypothetical protein K6T78_07580 [Alicyclobacillus sp.]|nr:hypothetical protein [Alicyclobacillus sp.]